MDARPTPGLPWRIFASLGISTLTVVSLSDPAWERFRGVTGDAVPRSAIRQMVATTFGLHALESAYALFRARSLGLEHPGRWAASALLWGFPVLRRLGRAGRAGAATEGIDGPAAVAA